MRMGRNEASYKMNQIRQTDGLWTATCQLIVTSLDWNAVFMKGWHQGHSSER